MNADEKYRAWKERRGRIDIRDEFTEGVMRHIYHHEEERRKSLLDVQDFFERISSHPFVKVGLLGGGAVIGFIRVALTMCLSLR